MRLLQKCIFILLTIFISSHALAEADLNWSRLLNHIEVTGVHTPTYVGDYLSISNVQPNDRTKERTASYISLVGGLLQDGRFVRRRVEVVWENWQFDQEHQFRVDQWLLALDLSGKLIRRSRSVLILTDTGTKTGEENPFTSDTEFQDKWKSIQAEWYESLPE